MMRHDELTAVCRAWLDESTARARASYGPGENWRDEWRRDDPEWFDLTARTERVLTPVAITETPAVVEPDDDTEERERERERIATVGIAVHMGVATPSYHRRRADRW